MTKSRFGVFFMTAALAFLVPAAGAGLCAAAPQAPPPSKPPVVPQAPASPKVAPTPQVAPMPQVAVPADYVIGTDDVLVVMFRREKDMSAEVVVRPDGRITLPLLNDIQAAGLSPTQLRDRVTEEGKRFVEDPAVTVMVKQVNSRKVFITGQVGKPGPYPLGDRMTVMQLISMAGGLTDYAKKKNIVIIRDAGPRPGVKPVTFRFNYDDIQNLKNLGSNIELRPGDTVIVP
jgi:polysaccharide export outer membrane protein